MTAWLLLAGVASLEISPPLQLPMTAFVERQEPALGYGLPLEVSAVVFEDDGAESSSAAPSVALSEASLPRRVALAPR